MLTVFLHVERNRSPSQHDLEDFCNLVDAEIHNDPKLDAPVAEIAHYKEKAGL